MQNFTSIDLFVVVACRENSLYYSRQFGKPVITPYELCLALSENLEWEGKILTDFEHCIRQVKAKEIDEDEKQQQEDEHQIMVQEYGELANVYDQSTIERFREMTFQGLEIVEDVEPSQLENGKVGIATEYSIIDQ